MNYIGDTLRKLRTAQKKSKAEIADIINIDRKTYTSWENNLTDVKGSYIPLLAEVFDVEISDLFNQAKNLNIKQKFDNNANSINTAILILTDGDAVDRVFDVLNLNPSK